MKYLKRYNEDIDWEFDDEEDELEGIYYLIRSISYGIIELSKIEIIKKSYNGLTKRIYSYKDLDSGEIIWRLLKKDEILEDLDKKKRFNSIFLFHKNEWRSDDMKKIFKWLTGKELPYTYNKPIRAPHNRT